MGRWVGIYPGGKYGEVSEWFKNLVQKTSGSKGPGGSNPSLFATFSSHSTTRPQRYNLWGLVACQPLPPSPLELVQDKMPAFYFSVFLHITWQTTKWIKNKKGITHMKAKSGKSTKKIDQHSYSLTNYLAKAATAYAFRNGPVEDIHADGRISQEEMKRLNQFMVQRIGEVFYLLLQGNSDDLTNLLAFSSQTTHGWDNLDLSELDERIHLGERFVKRFLSN